MTGMARCDGKYLIRSNPSIFQKKFAIFQKISRFEKKFRDFFAVSKKINFMDKMTGMMRDGPG